MAGRAGRQGIDSEGLVITHLEPRDLEEAPMKRLFSGAPEPNGDDNTPSLTLPPDALRRTC